MQKLNWKKLKMIDLSHKIFPLREPVSPEEICRGVIEEELVWPIETYDSYVDDTVCQYLKLKTHVKTHIESPWHLDKKGKILSDFPLDYFVGRMVNICLDLPNGEPITKDIIEKYDGGSIREGDIVICHSVQGESPPNSGLQPRLTPESAQYLIDKKIHVFGQDNSVSTWHRFDGQLAHDMLLKSGIPLLEMLANLDQLSEKVALLIAIPGLIKIQSLDSSTTPVLAIEGIDFE